MIIKTKEPVRDIEDLLNQWTEQGCPSTIEVSEDCISRADLFEKMQSLCPETDKGCGDCHKACDIDDCLDFVMDAPSVVPSRAEGEWQITDAYPHNVYCSECHKRFAQTHWAVWEDGSLPRNYCPNCGADMRGDDDELI